MAAFTSGAYFLHNERWWQWICEFYTCCLCYRMLQNAFLFHKLTIWSAKKRHKNTFFPTLNHLSLVIFAIATVVAFVLLRNPRFSFHCYTQHEAMPTQKSARKWCCDLSRLLAWKITEGFHSCKPASLNRPIWVRFLRQLFVQGQTIVQVSKTDRVLLLVLWCVWMGFGGFCLVYIQLHFKAILVLPSLITTNWSNKTSLFLMWCVCVVGGRE